VPQGVAADAKANTVRHHQRLDVRHQWVLQHRRWQPRHNKPNSFPLKQHVAAANNKLQNKPNDFIVLSLIYCHSYLPTNIFHTSKPTLRNSSFPQLTKVHVMIKSKALLLNPS
jgi:hypothetical protein